MSHSDPLSSINSQARTRTCYQIALGIWVLSILVIPLQTVWFSAGLYFAVAAVLLVANLQVFLVTLLIVVRFAVVIISIVSIDLGTYVSEQFRYGFNNGSTATYAPYLILFLLVFHYSAYRFTNRFIGKINLGDSARRRYFWILLIGYAGINAAFGATLVLYGVASDLDGDRFVYWAHLPDQVRSSVMFIRSWGLSSFAVFLGFYTRYVKKPSKLLLIGYSLTFIELFLMGEKFAGLFNNFFLFLTGLAIAGIVTEKPIRLRFTTVLGSLLVTAGLYFALDVGYQQLSGGRADSVDSIFDRIVLEAHVWFGILDLGRGLPFVSFHDMWKPNSLSTPSGLDYLSYLITSPSYVYQRLSGGIPFTMGGAPAALAVFGHFAGMLFFGFEAFLYPLTILAFLSFLRAKMLIPGLVSLIGFNLVMLTAVMGYWDVYHSRVSYIWVAIILGGHFVMITRRKPNHTQPLLQGQEESGTRLVDGSVN